MKCLVTLVLLSFLYTFSVISQSEPTYLSHLGGLKRDNLSFFEVEGYSILVQSVIQEFSEKNIKKLRKETKVPKDAVGKKDSTILKDNMVFRKQKNSFSQLTQYEAYYLVPRREQSTFCISFFSLNKQDIKLEQTFVNDFISGKIPDSIYEKSIPTNINFGGRKINIGNDNCNWMAVHNLQCPYFGQMNWSLHRTEEDAHIVLNAEYLSTKSQSMGEIKEEKTINIEFEGVPTTAKRVIYKVKIPKFFMGGSNVLVIYYVVAFVRGSYIQCVMSHYTNDNMDQTGLPPLLSQVMKFK